MSVFSKLFGGGRSAEQPDITNKITQLATGSGAYKTNTSKKDIR